MLVSTLHAVKAKLPMDVTEVGMVTDTNEVQLLKALAPMDATEVGMVTDTNEGHELKAFVGISVKLVTPCTTVKLERLVIVILLSRELNSPMLNAFGEILTVVLLVKVTDTVCGCTSVIVIDPPLRSIVTFGSS